MTTAPTQRLYVPADTDEDEVADTLIRHFDELLPPEPEPVEESDVEDEG